MDRDIRVVRTGSDGEGMPLVVADFGAIEEQPLSGLVLHARLLELDFDGIVRVANDFDDFGRAPASNLAVQAIEEVQAASNKLPSPALVTNAVRPEVVLVERREGGRRVSDETARCMCIHTEQEWDEKMVRVPESLERLLSNPVMSGGVDQKHAKKHDMSSYSTCLGVVDLKSDLWSHLYSFNVKETRSVLVSEEGILLMDLLDVMR